jgi:hypothetical protein
MGSAKFLFRVKIGDRPKAAVDLQPQERDSKLRTAPFGRGFKPE